MARVLALIGLSFGLAACGPGGFIEDLDQDGGRDGSSPLDDGYCGGEREPCCRGTLCEAGLTCSAGSCTGRDACGREGQPCCDGVACASGLVCQELRCARNDGCGGERQPCCTGGVCGSGLVCDRDLCSLPEACGGERQPCCDPGLCASGLVCEGGFCQAAPPCGGPRQPCCAGTACNAGLVCRDGRCDTDESACGDLGQSCCAGDLCTARELACCSGGCVDSQSDPRHCGGCGVVCEGTCSRGACDPSCGDSGEPCCPGAPECAAGLECRDRLCRAPSACTAAGGACAEARECCSGLSCRDSSGRLICCGEASGSCRTTTDCCGLMACDAGRCACRTSTQTCSTTADCCSGLSCSAGRCTASADPCAGITDCTRCILAPGCGFCRSSSTCVVGTSSGPTAGTCSDWGWYDSACGTTDTCASSTTCSTCTARSTCGFCETTRSCATGSWAGPASGSCADWSWYSTDCGSADPCAGVPTCGDCTVLSGCGWCESAGLCQAGTSAGPSSGTCGDWDWFSSSCGSASSCSGATSCSTCTAMASCGFCASSSTCLEGTYAGPRSGTCSDWDWYASDCGSDPCSSHSSCAACTASYPCGWCATTGACQSGTSVGPEVGTCSNWDWLSGDCSSADGCTSSTSCSACTSLAGCGWCATTGLCAAGSWSGPTSGTCSSWDWYSSDCSGGYDACNSSATCSDCTSRASCGFCASSSTCMTGTWSGPSSGSCSDWDWYSSDCSGGSDACNSSATCSDCTSRASCGFCASSSTCMTGTWSGPASGSCSDWDWYSSDCSGTADPCVGSPSCSDCTSRSTCGWCAATSSCAVGTSAGPSSGSCSNWDWYSSDCGGTADPCASATSCASCTAMSSCGFCEDSWQCLTGTSTGPSVGSCWWWDWYSSDCP